MISLSASGSIQVWTINNTAQQSKCYSSKLITTDNVYLETAKGRLSPSAEHTKGGKVHGRAAVELEFVVDELVGGLSLDRLFGHLVLWYIVGGIARAICEGVDVGVPCEMVARRGQLCVADHLFSVDVFVQHGVCFRTGLWDEGACV